MKKWIVGCLFIFSLSATYAQSLGFATHATPGLADTLIKNSNITYGVTVQSTGFIPVPGDYTVYIGVLDTGSTNVFYVDSVNVISNSFQPGDSSLITITHLVDPIYFMDGGNTVVIWPAAPGVQTTDTIFKDVFVINFESTPENKMANMTIYPNPATDILIIQIDEMVEKVRIIDLQGKTVATHSNKIIPITDFINGIYFIEVTTASDKIMRRKIIIQR